MGRRDHPKTFLLVAIFSQSTPSCLKVIGGVVGWGGVGGPCDYRVSPRSKSFFFSFLGGLLFDMGTCWDQDLDQGLTIKLSNSCSKFVVLHCSKLVNITNWSLFS